MRGIAYRRMKREAKIKKAERSLVLRGLHSQRLASYWADNLAKCSCWLCKGVKKQSVPTVQERIKTC